MDEARKVLYEEGMKQRRRVMGDAFVERALKQNSSDFAQASQNLAVEGCWGTIWTRSGLSHQQRSLCNIAMLSVMGKEHELAGHVRGALNNGCTIQEIQEVLLQVMVYAGTPTGLAA